MSKHPSTLGEDIYALLDRSVHHEPNPDLLKEYGERASATLARSFELRDKPRDPTKLWFSDLGETCERKIWYTFNAQYQSETIQGHSLFKFSYGDQIEDKVAAEKELFESDNAFLIGDFLRASFRPEAICRERS